MKEIVVKLKTEDGLYEIGKINLNPDVINDMSEVMKKEIYFDESEVIESIVQLGRLAVECESSVYLYEVYKDSQVDFYFVEHGYLYDKQTGEYFTEIQVGELIKADDLKTAYRKFVEKVNERW
jgi:hypothetical protein